MNSQKRIMLRHLPRRLVRRASGRAPDTSSDVTFAFAQTSSLSLLPPDTGNGRDLFHPLRDLAFVEVVHGFEFHAPRSLAHPHRHHRRYRLECRAVHEHDFDVAGEAAATEAPAVADAIVRHAPLHGAL